MTKEKESKEMELLKRGIDGLNKTIPHIQALYKRCDNLKIELDGLVGVSKREYDEILAQLKLLKEAYAKTSDNSAIIKEITELKQDMGEITKLASAQADSLQERMDKLECDSKVERDFSEINSIEEVHKDHNERIGNLSVRIEKCEEAIKRLINIMKGGK